MVNDMNRKFTLLWAALFLLGVSAAWADGHVLPDPADDDALAQLPVEAATGLQIAADKTAGLPEEATIRLMNNADDDDAQAVTHDVQLPDADGIGLDTARSAFSAADNASDFGEDIAENGADNIADRGRAEDLPVDVPGRPDNPPTP